MNETSYDRGYREGIEPAKELLCAALLDLGAKRFGAPVPEIESRVRSMKHLVRLEELTERILDAQSWDDLLQALGKQ